MSEDHWVSAYGEPYDPRPAIQRWKDGEVEAASQELWEQLYHQGAVNSASYAAVGELVQMMIEQVRSDWNAYALIASIEEGRLTESNPSLPSELKKDYKQAWAAILPLALRDLSQATDDLLVRSAFAVLAHAKGQHTLATIALCTEDERAEMLGR